MPRVDFYLLNQCVPDGRLRYTCRLTKKIYALGHRVFIHTRDSAQCGAVDDLLWTFDQGSFIPHRREDEPAADEDPPVVIGCRLPPTTAGNVLISLVDGVADHGEYFERIAEVVDATPEDKAAARDRFRIYRDRGWSLQTHNVRV